MILGSKLLIFWWIFHYLFIYSVYSFRWFISEGKFSADINWRCFLSFPLICNIFPDLKTLPNTQKIKGHFYWRTTVKNFFFSLEDEIQKNHRIRWNSQEDNSVRGAATACVIYQVRAANWAVCQSQPLWLIAGAASSAIADQKVGFSLGKRNETDIWIPDWAMVEARHNHTCGLSEMLIEVSSALSFYSINQGECGSEFLLSNSLF